MKAIRRLPQNTIDLMHLMRIYPDIPTVIQRIIEEVLKASPRDSFLRKRVPSVSVLFYTDPRNFRLSFSLRLLNDESDLSTLDLSTLCEFCERISVLCETVLLFAKATQIPKDDIDRTDMQYTFSCGRRIGEYPFKIQEWLIVELRKCYITIPVRYEAALSGANTIASQVLKHLALIFMGVHALEIQILSKVGNESALKQSFCRPPVRNTKEGIGYAMIFNAANWQYFSISYYEESIGFDCELFLRLSRRAMDRQSPFSLVVYSLDGFSYHTWAVNKQHFQKLFLKHLRLWVSKNDLSMIYIVKKKLCGDSKANRPMSKNQADKTILTAFSLIIERYAHDIQSSFSGKRGLPNASFSQNFKESSPSSIPQKSLVFSFGRRFHVPTFTSIGKLDNTIVIGQFAHACVLCHSLSTGDIFAVDQHGAHERVRLERFQKNINEMLHKRQLECPEIVENVPLCLIETFAKYKETVLRWGFSATVIKPNSLLVFSVPYLTFPGDHCSEAFYCAAELCALLQELESSTASNFLPKVIVDKLITRSCRGAIMFGDKLSYHKCTAMWKSLCTTNQPSFCSHGRKIIVSLLKLI